MTNHRQLILWRTCHQFLTLDELALAAGLHPELVDCFYRYGLVEPVVVAGRDPIFAAPMVQRLHSIMRIREDLGVNLPGVAVVLGLRERIEELQREIDWLRRRLELLSSEPIRRR